MVRSSRFWLVAVASAFWPAMLLAFWLGSLTRTGAHPANATIEASPRDGVGPAEAGTAATIARPVESPMTAHTPGPTAPLPRPSGDTGGTVEALGIERAPAASDPEDLGARDFAPGTIVELNYEFADETSRQEFEADQKARWEARKAVEIVRVCEFLARELALDSIQSTRLRDLLQDESQRRIAVVDDLTAGRIDQTRFRRQVDQIRAAATRELQSLFTAEQLAHYRTLEPRKQVLLDGSITGR